MKNEHEIKVAAAFQKCMLKAIKEIGTCFHPECNLKSINSHILQKNGILSVLEKEGHVREMGIDPFKDDIHYFNRIGINKAFSFKCFCNKHDTDLFKSIETDVVEIAENLYFIAQFYQAKGDYNAAQSYAYKAANMRPGWGDPYIFIVCC